MAGRKLRPNRASAWLTKRFRVHGAQMALSRESEVDQALLSRLARGAHPGFATAMKLKRWIPFAWWTQDEPESIAPPEPDDDDEQTLPVLDPAPLQLVETDSDPEAVDENPLDVKYPSSAPPPPPSEDESERVSERPRRGSSDPLGYV